MKFSNKLFISNFSEGKIICECLLFSVFSQLAWFNYSSQPTGGAAQRYEGRCDAASGHTLQSPTYRSTFADVREKHSQQTSQQGQ